MIKNNPKNHSFSKDIIHIAIAIKLQTSAGFRAIQKIIAIYISYMGLSLKAPSYSSILLWTKKVGYAQLEVKKRKADDWVIILDESVEFGHDKLLVIYGICIKELCFKGALNYQDLTPLTVISGDKWTGELIKKEIQRIEAEYGKIVYAVADGGNAIKKALRLSKIPHVYDITHKFAWFLKEIYKDDRTFQSYVKTMARMRGTLSLSDVSHVLPPNQRFHSRFMNLDILSDWGQKVLNYLDQGKTKERAFEKLKWVSQYRSFIDELVDVNQALSMVGTILKNNGISINNVKKAKKCLKSIKIRNTRTSRLIKYVNDFLGELLTLMPDNKKIICTSDIIESAFGKYKNYINNNPMVGITDLSLTMAAFTCKLKDNEIKEAMETVKVMDLKQWSIKNIGETNLQRRKKVLQKVG